MTAIPLFLPVHQQRVEPLESEISRVRELKQRDLDSTFLGVTSTAWKVGTLIASGTIFCTVGLTLTVLGFLGYVISPIAVPVAICSLLVGAVIFVIYGLTYHYESDRYLTSYREESGRPF